MNPLGTVPLGKGRLVDGPRQQGSKCCLAASRGKTCGRPLLVAHPAATSHLVSRSSGCHPVYSLHKGVVDNFYPPEGRYIQTI